MTEDFNFDLEDFFDPEAPDQPDLASTIAAEIMGLRWTHIDVESMGDEEAADEHCNRYGQLLEIISKHLLERGVD